MILNKRVIAFIPARGGSKRLPRKNILPIAGKPLIMWSIDAARNSQYIDEIFVSTDDQEIADIVEKSGIKVPELRPKELASDTATTQSVLIYTLDNFFQHIDIVVVLQPTSPLRTTEQIDQALELFEQKKALSIVSVTPCEHSPLWANTLPEDGSMEGFIDLSANRRSQDIASYYRLNGAIYIYGVNHLLHTGEMSYTKNTFAYKMNNQTSIDIDTQLDFDIAELIFSQEARESRD